MLAVVGTRSPVAAEQARRLAACGAAWVRLRPPGDAGGWSLSPVAAALAGGRDVVVSLDPAQPGRGPDDPALVHRLAAGLAPYLQLAGGLVATGGDTARALLGAAGVTGIRLLGAVEPGVPLGVTMGGQAVPVVTKAGSFGDRRSLERARDALRRCRA